MDVYEKRYNEFGKIGVKLRPINIIDLMCEHNQDSIKNNRNGEIISRKLIIGNITAFAFAGMDTVVQAATAGLMHMAQNHQVFFSKLRNEGLKNLDQIEKNSFLDQVMKETLRMYNPAPNSVSRIICKNMEVSGVKLYKGCCVHIPVLLTRYNKKYIGNIFFLFVK